MAIDPAGEDAPIGSFATASNSGILRAMPRPLPLLALLALTACSSSPAVPHSDAGADAGPSGPPCSDPRFAGARFSSQCEQFVDVEGRAVFLHGVNARVEGLF